MNPLESSKAELAELFLQRNELNRKIAAVEEAIRVLGPIYEPPSLATTIGAMMADLHDFQTIGITDAIEKILTSHPNVWFAPTSVRDALLAANFTVKGDNPMASIHQVLKRLVARTNSPFMAGEMSGQTAYKYDPTIQQMTVGAKAAITQLMQGAARYRSGGKEQK